MESWAADPSFGDFVVAHQRSLLRFAYLVAGNQADAEDAVQDALIAVSRRWDRVTPDARLAYLRRAVTNRALEQKRRTRARRENPQDITEGVSTGGVLRYEDDQAFVDLLQELPPKQRAALILRYYLDLGDEDVASYLGCSPQTVRSQIHRALAKLRQTHDPVEGDSDEA